jgi:hypothetical protein
MRDRPMARLLLDQAGANAQSELRCWTRIGRIGLGGYGFLLYRCRKGLCLHTRGAFRQDHRMSGRKIGWKRFSRVFHAAKESYSPAITKPKPQPTEVGRQVCCGFRQSMPDSR